MELEGNGILELHPSKTLKDYARLGGMLRQAPARMKQGNDRLSAATLVISETQMRRCKCKRFLRSAVSRRSLGRPIFSPSRKRQAREAMIGPATQYFVLKEDKKESVKL